MHRKKKSDEEMVSGTNNVTINKDLILQDFKQDEWQTKRYEQESC